MMQLINVSLGAHGLDPFFQVVERRMAGTKLSLRRYNVIFFQGKEKKMQLCLRSILYASKGLSFSAWIYSPSVRFCNLQYSPRKQGY